jgi:hypothetical protein
VASAFRHRTRSDELEEAATPPLAVVVEEAAATLSGSYTVSPHLPHRRTTGPSLEPKTPGHSSLSTSFRNEGAAGSNPASSTEHPGQSDFESPKRSRLVRSCDPRLHRRATGSCTVSTSRTTRCSEGSPLSSCVQLSAIRSRASGGESGDSGALWSVGMEVAPIKQLGAEDQVEVAD